MATMNNEHIIHTHTHMKKHLHGKFIRHLQNVFAILRLARKALTPIYSGHPAVAGAMAESRQFLLKTYQNEKKRNLG